MLKRFNVTAESWQHALSLISTILDYNTKTYGESMMAIDYSEDGLPQIPITNKDWATWVGYEHDEQTLWFYPSVEVRSDKTVVRKKYGYKQVIPLAKSVIWNAALYLHFLQKPLHPRAIVKAVTQSLYKDSNCQPQEFITPLAALIAKLCATVLSIVCNDSGHINRCGLQILKDDLDTEYKGKTCTNKALRRRVCMQLVARGIGGLGTRTQQHNCILQALKAYPSLKGSAVRAIERMLTLDKKLLAMNDGVAILLPYTLEERKMLCANSYAMSTKDRTLQRVRILRDKLSRGVLLSAAERKFKYRHKELFK